MGAVLSLIKRLETRCADLENKIAFLERDIINNGVKTINNEHKLDSMYHHVNDNTAKLLNISLLEEGRSIYQPRTRKSHTSSSYN